MKICKRCIQPDTRPGIFFNDHGICGACLWEEEKLSIDWKLREEELKKKMCDLQKIINSNQELKDN